MPREKMVVLSPLNLSYLLRFLQIKNARECKFVVTQINWTKTNLITLFSVIRVFHGTDNTPRSIPEYLN